VIKAVMWDFGGVLTTSPFDAFARYEAERGLPTDFIRGINATNPDTNAWARLERNDISVDEFDQAFADESGTAGHEVRGALVLSLLAGDLRPGMVRAFDKIRVQYKTACLTNNIKRDDSQPSPTKTRDERSGAIADVMARFDYVIESSKAGIRKPDPEFYLTACRALAVEPDEAVFLDDLGVNLKPARQLGISTIKVTSETQALADLEAILEMSLR
jgi:putative hydrolase of the HAD superfamily